MAAPFGRLRTPRCAVSAAVGCVAVAMGLFPLAAQAAANHPLLFSISAVPSEHSPPPLEPLEDTCGLAVDSGGNIYASDYYQDRVEAFSSSGQFAGRYKGTEPLDGPCGLAFDPAGNLYVNNYHRNVVRYAAGEYAAGSGSVIAGAGADIAHPTGVAVDPATGNVFVDDRSYVASYAAPVHSGEVPVMIGLGTLQDGYGIAVSGFPATKGDVYVPDAAGNTVKIYNPAEPTNPIGEIDGKGTPQGGFTSLTDSAVAVDDSDGHVYVLDDLQPHFYEQPEAAVDEFNAAGEYRGQLPRLPVLVDGGPSGLAVDNTGGATQGNVYATSGNGGSSILAYGPTAPAHTLEVAETGAGTGTVESEPAGIACAGACAAEYNAGEAVTLTATPAAGSAFAGWSGAGCSGTAFCHVTLNADTEVQAEFEALPPQPLLSPAGISATAGPSSAAAPLTATTIPPAAFELSRPSVDGSTATLQATVPAAGTLSTSAVDLRSTPALQVPAGPATLRLHLNRRGERALRKAKRHRLALKVKVTFTPSDPGPAGVLSKTVTFKQPSREQR